MRGIELDCHTIRWMKCTRVRGFFHSFFAVEECLRGYAQKSGHTFCHTSIRTSLYGECSMNTQSSEHGLIKSRLSACPHYNFHYLWACALRAHYMQILSDVDALWRARMVIADGHNMHMFTITCNSSSIGSISQLDGECWVRPGAPWGWGEGDRINPFVCT